MTARSPGLVTRRGAVRAIGGAALAASLGACGTPGPSPRRVVLYSSADDEILKQVVAAFEKSSGVKVGVVTDTEATKTTGLVQRLLDEKDRPRADVWWSSEPLGTIRLAREGALAEHTPGSAAAGRPDALNARARWFVMPGRARVIACSTGRVKPDDLPRRAADLADERWTGRVGMARPQFGTTRAHMAALLATSGDAPLRAWLRAMKRNRVRLYDGNAAVVRAIANAEIDAGLADSDDVYAAQRNGWDVGGQPEVPSAPGAAGLIGCPGALVLPNTAALVAGRPAAGAAAELLDFLLGEPVERMLAAHESRHVPLRASVRESFPANAVPEPAALDLEKVADAVPAAMLACRDELGA